VTLQHTQYADEIIAWLKITGGTPLEVGVIEEIRDRLKEHAKNGSIIRVRLKNRGDNPIPANRMHRIGKEREIEWGIDEMDQLRRLARDGKTLSQIAEEMEGRSYYAVVSKMRRLNMKTMATHKEVSDQVITARHHDGILARARSLRERRLAEGRLEREVA
jgi:tRNA G18 (ribose-2'-O)-methylase SpoU